MFTVPASKHKWQNNVIINKNNSDIIRNDTNEKDLKGYKRRMMGRLKWEKKQKRSVTSGKISITLIYMQWKS